MTDQTEPIRIPIGRNITYAVRGMPEVPNAYGSGFLIPTEVSLTYRASEDSQLGRFHAYVKGQWRRDGEVVPSGENLPGQHYYGDPSTWPAWLAEEARLHDPAVPAPATDQAAEVAKHVTRAIFALKAPSPDGSQHYQSGWDDGLEAAMDAARDAVLAVLPAPADRAAVLREEAALIRAHCPDHLDADSAGGSWMDCHCDVADDMERRVAANSTPVAAPDASANETAAFVATSDRAAVLREAADLAEDVATRLHDDHEIERANGALQVMSGLRRMADGTSPAEAMELPYTHTDDDSDQLIIGVVNASTYDGDVPQVFVCTQQFSDDAKEETTVYVRPEFVERAVAAMRAARIEADRMAAAAQRPKVTRP